MDLQRIQTFQKLANKTIRVGSDCSGADAAFHAARQWVPGDLSNDMMSEAPGAEGPILFSLLNSVPKTFYEDVLRRGFSGYCLINGQATASPRDLDMYSAGTVCTDFCSYNQLNPKEFQTAPNFVFVIFFQLVGLENNNGWCDDVKPQPFSSCLFPFQHQWAFKDNAITSSQSNPLPARQAHPCLPQPRISRIIMDYPGTQYYKQN
jgi:hypothetical protein